MPSSKTLLRIILIVLGLAAVVGALGILFARTAVVGQVDATLVLTAICCALLMRISSRSGDQVDPRSLLFSTTLLAVEFVLGVIAIWSFDAADSLTWTALESMLALAGSGIPAVLFLRFDRAPVTRVAGRTGLVFSGTAFTLWMTAILLSLWKNSNWNLGGYGLSLGITGWLIVALLVGVTTDRWHWRWIGIITAVAACAVSAQYIHADLDWHTQPILVLSSIAFVLAHANIALRSPLKANQRWLVIGTIASVLVACGFANLAGFDEGSYIWDDPHGFNRFAGAAAVLGSCGTIALAILYRVNGRFKPSSDKSLNLAEMTVICPVCQRRQTIKSGNDACDECGVLISIKLEEPHCAACGYSLLMFKGDRCPECGAAIEHQKENPGSKVPGDSVESVSA